MMVHLSDAGKQLLYQVTSSKHLLRAFTVSTTHLTLCVCMVTMTLTGTEINSVKLTSEEHTCDHTSATVVT